MRKVKLRSIDLFAGIGGIRIGFESAGFATIYANDIDPYAAATYKPNFGDIDIPYPTLAKIESGAVQNPPIYTVMKIAAGFGISVDDLKN